MLSFYVCFIHINTVRNYWFDVSSPFDSKYSDVKRVCVRKICMSGTRNIVIEDMETEGLVLCRVYELNYSLKNINTELSKLFKYFKMQKQWEENI